jgi:F-type H+-transporting ATPase subunit a
VFGLDASLTSVSTAKITTVVLLTAYLARAVQRPALIPGRLQVSAEMLYEFVSATVLRVTGPEGKSSVPLIFSLFVFVFLGTLIGITPLHETFTSHLVNTLGLALTVFVYVNVIAFRRHGLGFFRFFLPPGVPVFVAPILVTVEIVSYLFRPITLGFRLFANIFAGHVMLKLFADFCTMLVAAFGGMGILASALPVLVMVILYIFEIIIIGIQSYIFILITSMYLRDAIHAH